MMLRAVVVVVCRRRLLLLMRQAHEPPRLRLSLQLLARLLRLRESLQSTAAVLAGRGCSCSCRTASNSIRRCCRRAPLLVLRFKGRNAAAH